MLVWSQQSAPVLLVTHRQGVWLTLEAGNLGRSDVQGLRNLVANLPIDGRARRIDVRIQIGNPDDSPATWSGRFHQVQIWSVPVGV